MVYGRVFYSDGVTSVGDNGLVRVFSIDGIRLDERFNESYTESDTGMFYASYPGVDVGLTPPPRIVIARACLRDGCSECTEYEEITWGGFDHPSRHNFILPVAPPPATATPTLTDTPSPTETAVPTSTLTSTPTSTPTYATDINGDSKVDAEDLLILLNDWQKVSGP